MTDKKPKLENLSGVAMASTSKRYFLSESTSEISDEKKAKLEKSLKNVEISKTSSKGKDFSDDAFSGKPDETKESRLPVGSLPAFIPI